MINYTRVVGKQLISLILDGGYLVVMMSSSQECVKVPLIMTISAEPSCPILFSANGSFEHYPVVSYNHK